MQCAKCRGDAAGKLAQGQLLHFTHPLKAMTPAAAIAAAFCIMLCWLLLALQVTARGLDPAGVEADIGHRCISHWSGLVHTCQHSWIRLWKGLHHGSVP